jgi:TRAP-type mannitol/chloroaromatic compound transport system substrate-binding protein
MYSEFNANNARALNTLITEHGVKLHRFSDEILTELARVSGEVVADAAGTDELTKRVFDSFMEARRGSMRWGAVSEQAFTHARTLAES